MKQIAIGLFFVEISVSQVTKTMQISAKLNHRFLSHCRSGGGGLRLNSCSSKPSWTGRSVYWIIYIRKIRKTVLKFFVLFIIYIVLLSYDTGLWGLGGIWGEYGEYEYGVGYMLVRFED